MNRKLRIGIRTTLFLVCLAYYSAAQIGPVSFTPDGQTIVFSYTKSGTCFIYKADLRTGNAKRLTKAAAGCESDPAFSKDGKLIAYSYSPATGAHSNLYLVNSDGSNPQRLLESEADDIYPTFTPNGSRLYFMRSRFFGNYSPIVRPRRHDFDLFWIDLKSKQVMAVTDQHMYEASPPSIHSAGKSIIFVGPGDENGTNSIYFESIGSGFQGLRVSPHVPNEPNGGPILGDAFYLHGDQPDKLTIIFQAASEGSPNFNYDVYRLTLPGGGKPEDLTPQIGYASGIRPAPDGKTAMFLKWNVNQNTNELDILDLTTRKAIPFKLSGID